MIQNWLRSGLLFFVFTAALHAQGREALIKSVNSIPGWTASGKAVLYDEPNIKKFSLELAAPLRTYGLNGVAVQTWKGPLGQAKATMFELLDSGGAFGFFTTRRKTENTPSPETSIGAESFRAGNHLYFWQSNYVVRLEGEPGAMEALAKALAEKILGPSEKPSIAAHLPSANLVAGSEMFMLDATNIQAVDGVDASALGFDSSAIAAGADYRVNGKAAHLLLMLYPTQQIAKKYADQFNAATPNLVESRKRIGPMLAIVSGTTDASIIQSIMEQVHYQSKVMWDEPKPGLGLGPIIVTVFRFIGVLLGLCVVVGIAFGGMRTMLKARYPNRVFDSSKDTEIIQLKLDQGLTRKELSE